MLRTRVQGIPADPRGGRLLPQHVETPPRNPDRTGLSGKGEEAPKGVGEARLRLFHTSGEPSKGHQTFISDPHGDVVTLFFQSLRRVCRHEKGGYCKERAGCEADNCPQTLG